jgi:F0F1-type ATP synthase assembly protein I
MGYYLDSRFGWSPWGTISLTMLGVIGGLYLLIKDALRRNRDEDRKP